MHSSHSAILSTMLPSILDIHLYRNHAGDVTVFFDCLHESLEISQKGLPYFNQLDDENDINPEELMSLRETMKQSHPKDSAFVYQLLPSITNANITPTKAYSKSSLTYVLPTRPHGLINWTGYLFRYINVVLNQEIFSSVHVNVRDQYPDFLEDAMLTIANGYTLFQYAQKDNLLMQHTLTKGGHTHERFIWNSIINKIKEMLKDNPPYHYALEALMRLTNIPISKFCEIFPKQYYSTHFYNHMYYKMLDYHARIPLLVDYWCYSHTQETELFAKIMKRSDQYKSELYERFKNGHVIQVEEIDNARKYKMTAFKTIVVQLIKQNETWLIPYLSDVLYIFLKWMFMQYRNQHHGALGAWDPEKRFLDDVHTTDFKIDNNGYLSIVNIQQNDYYQKNFKNHPDKFKEHMKCLFLDALKLTFIDENNINEIITFDRRSSAILTAEGFGLFKLNQVKKELYHDNFFRFLAYSKKSFTNEIHFLDLPMDVMKLIQQQLEKMRGKVKHWNNENTDMIDAEVITTHTKKRKHESNEEDSLNKKPRLTL